MLRGLAANDGKTPLGDLHQVGIYGRCSYPAMIVRRCPASICSRFSFSASCMLVVNPQHATPLQAHLVLETASSFRLILYWTRLGHDRTKPPMTF